MTDPDAQRQLDEYAAQEAAADARATKLLKWIGGISLAILLIWILVVISSFGG